MKFIIRKAENKDLDIIVQLFIKLSIDQMSKDKYYTGDFKFDGSEIQFKESLNNENCSIFVAEIENKIIGFIEIWLYKKDYYFFLDDYAYILHFFVDSSARKNENIYGIMFRLFDACKQWALEKKAKYLIADVFSHNPKVMKLVERVGLSSYRTRFVKKLN